MRKIHEVLRLHFEHGRSKREIARIINVSPTTVSEMGHTYDLVVIDPVCRCWRGRSRAYSFGESAEELKCNAGLAEMHIGFCCD
jgi:DNA-binding transcriptional regulator LsrR (DeoR family)